MDADVKARALEKARRRGQTATDRKRFFKQIEENFSDGALAVNLKYDQGEDQRPNEACGEVFPLSSPWDFQREALRGRGAGFGAHQG